MADITIKLIWYRLGETYSKMADAGAKMESWFSWEEHFLDVLLLFWISMGLLIVGVVNSFTQMVGPLKQPRKPWTSSRNDGSKSAGPQGPAKPESTFWLNTALNWVYLHYSHSPEFVDVWVQSLNAQANKLGGPVQIKFEKVQSGSLPPKFGDVTYDAGPEDKIVINARVDSRDLSFAVFASQQTHEGVKLTNLVITVLKLKGQLKVHCYRKGDCMMANASFSGRPDIKVEGKPVNPYQDPSDLVDVGVVQEVVRNTICLASTTFNLSDWIDNPADGIPIRRTRSNEMNRSAENLIVPGSQPSSPRGQQQQQVFEAMEVKEAKQQHSAFHVPTLATPSKTSQQQQQRYVQRGPQDKRLLVKVIKASGLKQGEGSVDPYCCVNVDSPKQSELTSVVRSSYNPFWDEQFFFDMNRNSQEIRIEVLDKRKSVKENFLGEAIVYCEDLQRNPSSRQIIPLQGKLGVGEFVSGSVTVEFLCMDPADDPTINSMSPRRTIETSKSMTPGGTLVTTTTTTTQKPQNANYNSNMDGSPSYIEKRGFEYEGDPDSSAEVIHINGVESVAETAIRELSERSKLGKKTPTKTSTLIITGVKREPVKIPTIKTIESSPTDDYDGTQMMSSPESPEITLSPQAKEKKSLAARIKKRFSRSKKRSHSADRATSSLREGSNYLRPPGPQSKDDIDLHKAKKDNPNTPNLKKSKSLGGSLKKLFRRSRKRSRSQGRGEQSRESSVSRQSRYTSQGESREGSLTRTSQSHNPSQDTVIL